MNRANASDMDKNRMRQSNPLNIRWMLVMYDLIIYAIVAGTMLVLYEGMDKLSTKGILQQVWLNYVDEHENAYYYENLNVDSFLYLVKNSMALIGNSSSGIIETPSLGRYTINIGDRQRGRVHGNSVIDVPCDSSIIGSAMKAIAGKNEEIVNPYYVENTADNYYKNTKKILENGTSVLKEFYDI